jgi:hypothetical protein
MEFHHKPKPWHGWREFLREYAIVVVGVLTAAAVGLTVDWLHRRTDVAEARHTLRLEIAENAATAGFNIEQERCLAARLDQFAAWANGGPRPPYIPSGGLPTFSTSSWAVVKSGAAAQMPLEERVAYSRFYDLVDSTPSLIERQRDVFLELLAYRGKPELTAPEARQLLEFVTKGRVLASVHSNLSTGVIQSAKSMGVGPAPISPANRVYLETSCSAVGLKPRLPAR